MQAIKEAELANLLKEIGLSSIAEGLSTQPNDGLSFVDFLNIVKERLFSIDKEVSIPAQTTSGDRDPNFYINLSDQQVCVYQTQLIVVQLILPLTLLHQVSNMGVSR